ncbi:hypothetical protein COT62_03160 [Candidatus Roizmanbacteria bacterium CG09_land_8_20_14_0_10_41_9]|uniref:Glycosyltransferase RgtA/B/C/D-like domain-containing protein n=1 Tax=Candidatus Roizmanbacteria bacterium CG09_land_8_20_14_0_10_41_9 TaxID=1974850 RepID=A0A2H0WS80_9BACT|nr:MAG: hypothetical protein COT62_03160 [Candidatus Roizmanbacteria bacterium CG09_land_8_20_14_0_10_41_9]
MNYIIKKFRRNIYPILFAVILLAAVVTRFAHLDKTAFFINDQGRDLLVLNTSLETRKIPLIGPSTSFNSRLGSFYFGPSYYYFLLPFFLISKDPLFITVVFPILFMVGLMFLLGVKDLIDREKAIFLILVVFSGFSIYYSRFIWNLNLGYLLSFIIFSVFLRYRSRIGKTKKTALLFGILSGLVFQVHYGMLFLYTGIIWFLQKNRRWMVAGILLSFAPFLAFDIRHTFILSRTFGGVIGTFLRNSKSEMFSFTPIFTKIFEFYLFPNTPFPTSIKALLGFIAYTIPLVVLFKSKRFIGRLLSLIYIFFLITFFIFKRDFDYYLACFFLYFYLGSAISLNSFALKSRYALFLTTFFLMIFSYVNASSYFSTLKTSPYSISKQKEFARIIAQNQPTGNKALDLSVFPHLDDRRGIEYLLLDTYDIRLDPNDRDKYIVCFQKDCAAKGCKILYKEQDVRIFKL